MSFGASPSTPPISQSTPPSPPSRFNPSSQASTFAKQKWSSSAHQPQLYLATLPTFAPTHDTGSSKSLQLGISRPKRKRITPEQLEVLSNLFEYTDTPTFDLREAIGSKLGMSNREVQVWFQNRRAKVNRQRIPPNSQVLQEPAISQQRDPSPPSQPRMKSLSVHPTLPGVSSILTSDPTAPPLLPPFQAILPGADQDEPMYGATPDQYPSTPLPPSPPTSRGNLFSSLSQLRRSPPASRRRIPYSTPASLYSRKSPRSRSPVTSVEDPARPLSPRQSSADPPAASDSDNASSANSHWNPVSSHTPWSSTHPRPIPQCQNSYMSLGSMRLDHLSQPKLPSDIKTPPHDWSPTPNEHSNQSVEDQFLPRARHFLAHRSPTSVSIPDSRCSSESFRYSQTRPPWHSVSGSAPPTTTPLPRHTEHNGGVTRVESDETPQSLAPSHPPRPSLAVDKVPSASRSLFASRYLPPLPNPVRPGPGSFPPPPALRVAPTPKDISPATLFRESAISPSEYKLPPLSKERIDG